MIEHHSMIMHILWAMFAVYSGWNLRIIFSPPNKITLPQRWIEESIEKVIFHAKFVGDGISVCRKTELHRPGKPVVFIVVSSKEFN